MKLIDLHCDTIWKLMDLDRRAILWKMDAVSIFRL